MLEAATIARTDKPLNSASGPRSSGRRAPGRRRRPTRGSPPPGRSPGEPPSGNALSQRVSAQRRRGNVICRSRAGLDGQLVSTASASCTTITAIRISTVAAPLDSRPEMAHQRAHFPHQRRNLAPSPDRLATVPAMLPRMTVAAWRSGQLPAVHPASAIAHRRRLAWRPSPRFRTAPRGRVHGIDVRLRGHPLPPPPLSTAPTIACPPAPPGRAYLAPGASPRRPSRCTLDRSPARIAKQGTRARLDCLVTAGLTQRLRR